MSHAIRRLLLLLCFGSTFPTMKGTFLGKLSSKKQCVDEGCMYAISLARAEDDFNAPDCRFINIRKGQLIYVYSKLVKEKKAEFWSGTMPATDAGEMLGTRSTRPRPHSPENPPQPVESVPATDAGETLGTRSTRPRPHSPENPQQPVESGCESLRQYIKKVYREQYEDQMGTIGYFPRNLVTEQHVFREANKMIPTKVNDFLCE